MVTLVAKVEWEIRSAAILEVKPDLTCTVLSSRGPRRQVLATTDFVGRKGFSAMHQCWAHHGFDTNTNAHAFEVDQGHRNTQGSQCACIRVILWSFTTSPFNLYD